MSLPDCCLGGTITKKNSSLHISDHGKDFLSNQQKLLVGDSKQTVEIVKIRMEGGKELAVKTERESECESYKEHCTACMPLFFQSFLNFLSYSVQIKPREVDREVIVATREAKQVPGSHSQGMVIPTGPRSSALQGWEPDACKGRVSRGNHSGGRAGSLEASVADRTVGGGGTEWVRS